MSSVTASSQLRRGIAKLVKALDFDSSIPRFESLFPCHSFCLVCRCEQRVQQADSVESLSAHHPYLVHAAAGFLAADIQDINAYLLGLPWLTKT